MRSTLFMGVSIALALLMAAVLAFAIVSHDASVIENENDYSPGNSITPVATLVTMKTGDLAMVTNNKGSGSKIDLTLYRPKTLDGGWYFISDVAEASLGAPTHQALLVRSNDSAALAPPEDWKLVYADHRSGAELDMSLWIPVPPKGYVALGCVAVRGYDKPVLPGFRCVNKSYCVKGKLGDKIWDDTWSGATYDGSAWRVIPDVSGGMDASTFWVGSSHDKPGDKVYCLNPAYLAA